MSAFISLFLVAVRGRIINLKNCCRYFFNTVSKPIYLKDKVLKFCLQLGVKVI